MQCNDGQIVCTPSSGKNKPAVWLCTVKALPTLNSEDVTSLLSLSDVKDHVLAPTAAYKLSLTDALSPGLLLYALEKSSFMSNTLSMHTLQDLHVLEKSTFMSNTLSMHTLQDLHALENAWPYVKHFVDAYSARLVRHQSPYDQICTFLTRQLRSCQQVHMLVFRLHISCNTDSPSGHVCVGKKVQTVKPQPPPAGLSTHPFRQHCRAAGSKRRALPQQAAQPHAEQCSS